MTNRNTKSGRDHETGADNISRRELDALPDALNVEDLMTDQNPDNDNLQDDGSSGADTPWASGEVIDGTAELQDPVALLVEENAKMKDQVLRTLADMENLRQRTAREVKEARAYAISNFARDMLNASDNMRRALEAVPPEARASADSDFKALFEGVELTERDMLKALENHGVVKIDPLNERFDPHFHQAMFEVPNPEVANGTIIEVVQPGYVIGDRVLRPALVGVAKGGPKIPKSVSLEEHNPSASRPDETASGNAASSSKTDHGSVGSRVDKSA